MQLRNEWRKDAHLTTSRRPRHDLFLPSLIHLHITIHTIPTSLMTFNHTKPYQLINKPDDNVAAGRSDHA